MRPVTIQARAHRTQQERREHTRTALLDATIDCLVDLGHARTTVQEICRRAGLSRGAQQHHFTTKAELMVAAVEHLVTRLRAEITGSLVLPRGPLRVSEAIELLWHGFSGKLSTAALELWIAARTDGELRTALVHYRAMFRELIGHSDNVPAQRDGHTVDRTDREAHHA